MENKKIELEQEKMVVEKAKRSSKDFAPLYAKYHKQIFAYVYSKVHDKNNSEDIVSTIFEKALKNIQKFKWQGIPFGAWLYRIARNCINDFLRDSSKKKTDLYSHERLEQEESKEESSLETLIKNESEEALLKAIAELKEEDQMLVYYRYFEDLSNKKIAQIMEMTETNVSTRLHRLRDRLRKIAAKNLGEY